MSAAGVSIFSLRSSLKAYPTRLKMALNGATRPFVRIKALRLTPIGDVPENACGVAEVEDADPPGLHRRRLAHDSRVLVGEIQSLDVLPPGIRILDGEAHHEIARVLGDVEGLQQESEEADLKLSDLVVAPVDGESEVGVELP
jgi:hypothetical protein